MSKRNVVAHSESLLDIENVVDMDYDWDNGEISMYPMYEISEPVLQTINEGKINYQNISKIVADFSKYFMIAQEGLEIIEGKLFTEPLIE